MEQTIIEKAITNVANGAKFKVDFAKGDLIIGKKFLIKDGKYEGVLFDPSVFSIEFFEYLYQIYKHSRPSERSERKQKKYFKAFKLDELDDEDMLFGEDREVAQCKLETYLLAWILMEPDFWKEKMTGWFWQSEKDKDLVILRDWVVRE